MDKAKLIKEVESIWEEMGCFWDEGYSISGHTLNKIVSRAYDNVSEKSSDISPIIERSQPELNTEMERLMDAVKELHPTLAALKKCASQAQQDNYISDSQISEESFNRNNSYTKEYYQFINGAKWMRQKLLPSPPKAELLNSCVKASDPRDCDKEGECYYCQKENHESKN